MEVFLQWGIMLLGILGVVQLGELLSIWLRRPKKRPTSFCVRPLHGSIGNVEQVLTLFSGGRTVESGGTACLCCRLRSGGTQCPCLQRMVQSEKPPDFLHAKRIRGYLQRISR